MSGLDKNRFRNQTVCFRATPEERREIEARIKVSGMPKDSIIYNHFSTNKLTLW